MHDMLSTLRQFKWHLAAFLALVLLHGSIHSAEESLPPDVMKAMAKCDEDIIKARKVLLVTLTKAQDKATKAGNLDAANALKAKATEIEKLTTAGDLRTSPAIDGNRFLAGIAGAWKVTIATGYQGVWTFTDKGAVTNSEGNKGTVRVVKNVLTVTWDIGLVETVDAYETLDKGTGLSGRGAVLTITRASAPTAQR